MLYAGMAALVGLIMLGAYSRRSVLELNVLHDRNPPYVLLSDGSIRNGYTVKILNKLHQPRDFAITARDLPSARVAIGGFSLDQPAEIRVATDDLRELKVFVTVSPQDAARLKDASTKFTLVVRDLASNLETPRHTTFQMPATQSGKAP
jgi:polyferredoxin